MIPCSDNFIKALTNPFTNKEVHLKIELYDSQMNYIDEISKSVTKNDVGNINIDISRPIRRSFNFSLDNSSGLYSWGESNIIWIDKRVKAYIGLKLADGSIEYIPQGLFILSQPQDDHQKDSSKLSVSGFDKAFLYTDRRGKFTNEQIIQQGVNIATAIKLIAQTEGETLFLFDEVTDTLPYELSYNQDSNRWQAMSDLAALAKSEIYYDVNGYLRLRKLDDLNNIQNYSSVWSFTIGDNFYAGNIRKLDETNLYNDFIAIGGGSSTATVRDQLTVTESNPLWVGSPYTIEKIGRITYFHNSGNADPLLITTDECHWRNKFELMRKLGYSEAVDVSISPHYLLDGNDVVDIEDLVNNVTGRYLINKIDIPINPSIVTMSVSKEKHVITDWNSI